MNISLIFNVMGFSYSNYSIKYYTNIHFIYIFFPYSVCRKWNMLTRSPTLWKRVNVNFHYSHESQTTVTSCFINTLPPCVTCIRINFKRIHAGWSEHLNFEELCLRLQRSCPCLKILIFSGAILSDNLTPIIDLCTQFLHGVKILVFRHSSFPSRRLVANAGGCSKIEILDISDCDFYFDPDDYEEMDFVDKPPFSRMPNLKQLHLYGSNVGYSWFQDDISFLNQLQMLNLGCTHIRSRTFLILLNHGHNLKELYLCEIDLQRLDVNFGNSVFPSLETICIRDSYVICEPIISLIQSCRSLQNVYVNDGMAKDFAAHPYVVTNRRMAEIVKPIHSDHRHNVDYFHN